jgi:hypothetical protein
MEGDGYGGTDSWCSPRKIGDGVVELYDGPADFDPCSNPNSIIRAKRAYCEGGLHIRWMGKGYENDPYSKTKIWTKKAMDEIYAGNCTELVRLVMCAPSVGWWIEQCGVWNEHSPPHMLKRKDWRYDSKRNLSPNPEIIITERLKFIGDKDFGARFDTALVYYGKRKVKFYKAFKHVTRWTTRGRV